MVSLTLFLAAFGPSSTRYGFPSGNSSTAPIDATATVTPVPCENALFPPPHRAGLWTLGLWILSTPNAEETQSSFSLGFVDSQCGHVSPSGAFRPGAFLPHHATSGCRCRLDGMPRWPSRPASSAGLESSTASSDRLMHGAGSTLEAAARPSGSKDSYLAACRRVLLETVGVGLYFAMRPRHRAHGMSLLFMLLVWFVIQQCARVTWLLPIGLGCLDFAFHHPDLVLKIGLYIMRERAPGAPTRHGGRSESLSPFCIQGAWATWCLPVVIVSLLVMSIALALGTTGDGSYLAQETHADPQHRGDGTWRW